MKKLIIILTGIVLCSTSFAQGIAFENKSFDEVLAKAKAENKMVFMDCYTVWCGPCKRLAKEIFTQKIVGDYFNEHFVSIKMDMEKGEGVELNKKYAGRAYPTLLFISADGKLIHKKMGFMEAEVLIEEAKKSVKLKK